MSRTKEDLFKSNYQMMSLSQLTMTSDSLDIKNEKRKEDFGKNLSTSYYNKSGTYLARIDSNKIKTTSENYFDKLPKPQKLSIIEAAMNMARNAQTTTESMANDIMMGENDVYLCNIEWHRKFTLSIACLVLFFIGAPLGAIIRKGGLGMPVVVSVLFFITFHILSITGEKLSREGELPPYQGMWMATAILLPVGIFLTAKATSDSTLFDASSYLGPIKKLFRKKSSI